MQPKGQLFKLQKDTWSQTQLSTFRSDDWKCHAQIAHAEWLCVWAIGRTEHLLMSAGTAIQALQRLAPSNPKLYKALLGMQRDSNGHISTTTLEQVSALSAYCTEASCIS